MHRLLFLLLVAPFTTVSAKTESLFPGKTTEWKQAGPGRFLVKNETATASGGMGLWWFAERPFGNFTLRLRFRSDGVSHNSGVFVRFPDPGDDPWVAVHEGYEIQIAGDDGTYHSTGAIYEAQPASHAPLRPAGEWNDYAISCVGPWIAVVLNGELVNVFRTQPGRGGKSGHIGIQNHDDGSPVAFREIEISEWPADATLRGVLAETGITRTGWTAHRAARLPENAQWFRKMDVGPAWSNTFADTFLGRTRTAALKGILVRHDADESHGALFDTETLRLATAYQGGVHWASTPWTGRHGENVRLANESGAIFNTRTGPGWADADGSFDDNRPHPGYGNLAHATFHGFHRRGESIVFDYSVHGSRVRETGSIPSPLAYARHLEIAPRQQDLVMLVADEPGAEIELSADGRSATLWTSAPESAGLALVATDRSDPDWNALAMGPPSAADPFNRDRTKSYFRILDGENLAKSHPRAGDEENVAVRLNDGAAAEIDDDTTRNFWFEHTDKPGRIVLDLGVHTPVTQVHAYSWHKDKLAPQRFTLWGAEEENANPAGADPAASGWTAIATVDTSALGQGGRHGSAIYQEAGKPLGTFRKLLFVTKPVADDIASHTFFSEIDVYTSADPGPAIRASAGSPLAVHLAGDTSVKLEAADDGRLLARIKGSETVLFTVGLTRGDARSLGDLAPPAFEELVTPGRPLYPEMLTLGATLSGDDSATWVTDHLAIPLENPWHSSMRIGGMDFFSEGDRAAVSTWNGDVWIISGLNGDWEELTWQRHASGLFEPLGLRIVDDLIYVHGRDQITRLHDSNGDGSADHFEAFNRDVLITQNFHEFAFDLHTDTEGNFYFSKAAPVLAGGRGFDKILDHHGVIARIDKNGGNFTVLATGIRAPGGLGVGPEGQITVGENEGTWQPVCKLSYIPADGIPAFLGTEDASQFLAGEPMREPLMYFPMDVDNSSGSQVWVPEGLENFGIPAGSLIHLSYGKSALYHILPQKLESGIQGASVKFPVSLSSSAMRGRFHPDGSLYVAGFRGWQTNAANEAGITRVRHTGTQPPLPVDFSVSPETVTIVFPMELDAELAADLGSYTVSRWKYIRGPRYGSGQFSIDNPDLEAEARALETESLGHKKQDPVKVTAARLLDDGRTVELTIPSLKPAQQMRVAYDLETAEGEPLIDVIHHTIHEIPNR